MAEVKLENMQTALLKFKGAVNIKGIGPGEVRMIEGAIEKAELWITGGSPRLLLVIENRNFVNIGETLFTVRNGGSLIEVERLNT